MINFMFFYIHVRLSVEFTIFDKCMDMQLHVHANEAASNKAHLKFGYCMLFN